jgi:branched-chain amino acid transport system permease protein
MALFGWNDVREHFPAGVLLAGALAFPLLTNNLFLQDAVIFILLWAGLAGAWNIAGGFAGQLSLGHAAFFGLGAYTSTLLKIHTGVSPWIGMLCGGAVVVIASGFIAFAATRLRGPYFALVTIAFASVLQIVAARWYDFTRGNEGLSIPFEPALANFMFTGKLPWTVIVLCYVAGIYALATWIKRSRFGYQLAGMREDDDAVQALGVDTRRLKVLSIALSAFLTALGGTFYAQYVGFVDPGYVFSIDQSVKFALMCIIGGMGTALGPVLGAALMTALEMALRAKWGGEHSGLYLIVYGALLIVVVRVMPEGLVVGVPQAWKRWSERRAA